MRRILVGAFLILSLAGIATAAQASHCESWTPECFWEDQRLGGS